MLVFYRTTCNSGEKLCSEPYRHIEVIHTMRRKEGSCTHSALVTDLSFIMELKFWFDCLSLTYTGPILFALDKTAYRKHFKGIMKVLK